jgi:hypothetical protein
MLRNRLVVLVGMISAARAWLWRQIRSGVRPYGYQAKAAVAAVAVEVPDISVAIIKTSLSSA